MNERTSVLVVGGGLSGLTTAALLAHHGVRCLLVERHHDTSIQYKFAGISPRSMEIFRGLGLERSHETPDDPARSLAWIPTSSPDPAEPNARTQTSQLAGASDADCVSRF